MIRINNESRGTLGVIEFADLPFVPARTFWIASVPAGDSRGHHAHHSCEQFLTPLTGSVRYSVITRENETTEGVLTQGDDLHLPVQNWIVLTDFTSDCVVLVYCSEPYDEADYIRDLGDFLGG